MVNEGPREKSGKGGGFQEKLEQNMKGYWQNKNIGCFPYIL